MSIDTLYGQLCRIVVSMRRGHPCVALSHELTLIFFHPGNIARPLRRVMACAGTWVAQNHLIDCL